MTRFKLIELLKEYDDILLSEPCSDLHDLARERTHCDIEDAIEKLIENECDERG